MTKLVQLNDRSRGSAAARPEIRELNSWMHTESGQTLESSFSAASKQESKQASSSSPSRRKEKRAKFCKYIFVGKLSIYTMHSFAPFLWKLRSLISFFKNCWNFANFEKNRKFGQKFAFFFSAELC